MFKQFRPCPFKPKLLNVTIDEHAPDPFQKQIYDLEELEVVFRRHEIFSDDGNSFFLMTAFVSTKHTDFRRLRL